MEFNNLTTVYFTDIFRIVSGAYESFNMLQVCRNIRQNYSYNSSNELIFRLIEATIGHVDCDRIYDSFMPQIHESLRSALDSSIQLESILVNGWDFCSGAPTDYSDSLYPDILVGLERLVSALGTSFNNERDYRELRYHIIGGVDEPLRYAGNIPPHWRLPKDAGHSEEVIKAYQDKIIQVINDSRIGDRDDPYYAHVKRQEVLAEITGDETVKANEVPALEISLDLLNVTASDLLANVEPHGYSLDIADTGALRRAESQLEEAQERMSRQLHRFVEHQRSLPEKIKTLIVEEARNKAGERINQAANIIFDKARLVAQKRLETEIEEINKTSKKWGIFYDRDGRYVAMSRNHIVIQGDDGNEYSMGYCYVTFTKDMITGINVNGLAHFISPWGWSCHPHLGTNGDTTMCFGNLSDNIVSAIGDRSAKAVKDLDARARFSGNSASSSRDYSDIISKLSMVLPSKLDIEDLENFKEEDYLEIIYLVSEMMYIGDLKKYLNYVYILLKDVDYDSPYVTISEYHINRGIKDRTNSTSFSEHYDKVRGNYSMRGHNHLLKATKKGLITKESLQHALEWYDSHEDMSDHEASIFKECYRELMK